MPSSSKLCPATCIPISGLAARFVWASAVAAVAEAKVAMNFRRFIW
jgi:hypothetical protein